MKTTIQKMSIDEVRLLLELWYNAEISVVDEARLVEWFVYTPDHEMPADMLADAAIMRAMAASHPAEEEIQQAASQFEEKLGRTAKSGNRKFMVWLSSAAAVAVIVVSAVTFLSRDTDLTPDQTLTAHSTVFEGSTVQSPDVTGPDTSIGTTIPQVKYVSSPIRKASNEDNISLEEAQRAMEKVYAILDKAEIDRTLDMALALFDKNVATSQQCLAVPHEALSRIDRVLDETLELTKSVN